MKHLHLRFSVRALLAAVAIVAVYFGLWEATKKWGAVDLKNYLAQQEVLVEREEISVPVPLVMEAGLWGNDSLEGSFNSMTYRKHYYVWFFGYVMKVN